MRRSLLLLLVPLALVGCAASSGKHDTSGIAPPPGPTTMRISSPAFADHGKIPASSTCDGAGSSPELDIMGVPGGATVALLVGDPDAPLPQAPQENFTHWLAWNAVAPADGNVTFPEGHAAPGAIEGRNSADKDGWTPPCPPQGSTAHHYVFTALAVDRALALRAGGTRAQLEAELQGHVLSGAALTGCYMRLAQAPLPC